MRRLYQTSVKRGTTASVAQIGQIDQRRQATVIRGKFDAISAD